MFGDDKNQLWGGGGGVGVGGGCYVTAIWPDGSHVTSDQETMKCRGGT